jgi:hypothetical protein
VLRAKVKVKGAIKWPKNRSGISCAAFYAVDTLDSPPGMIRLCYQHAHNGQVVDQEIGLTTTPLPWGGLKWWFLCPRCWSGLGSLRRRKLYLPPGATDFGCRQCYDLTYVSSQNAHQYETMYRSMAAEIGGDWKDIRDMLTED